MDIENDSYNFKENSQGEDKGISNPESSIVKISQYLTQKNFQAVDDESSSFERNKKFCTWHPPLKTEKEIATNEFSEIVNFCVNSQLNTNTSLLSMLADVETELPEFSANHSKLSATTSQGNEESELSNFLSCSTIQKINEAFNSYNDCEQEIKSLSSLETLPTEVVADNEDLIYNEGNNNEKNMSSIDENEEEVGLLNTDLEYLNNEKEIVNYENEENISEISDKNVKCSNDEHFGKLDANLVLTVETGATSISTKETEDQQLKLKTLFPDKCLSKKVESSCDLNYSDHQISGDIYTEESNSLTNFGIQAESLTTNDNKVIQQYNVSQTKAKLANVKFETCNDDTFDLTFTNSQLEKLDQTTAVYNSYSNKSTNLWIRKKQEQKAILRKAIKEIDMLNNSVVQATHELRAQFCKNYSKKY